MNHREIKGHLPEYVDGSISPERRDEIERHLETCQNCRAEVGEFKKLLSFCENVSYEPPSEDYWISLIPRFRERLESRTVQRKPVNKLIPVGVIGAVIVFMILISIFLLNRPVKSPRAIPDIDRVSFVEEAEAILPLRNLDVNYIDDLISNLDDEELILFQEEIFREEKLYEDLEYGVFMVIEGTETDWGGFEESEIDFIIERLSEESIL